MTKPASPRSKLRRLVVVVAITVTSLSTALFGLRTYNSFLLLRSAYAAGAPRTSSIRPWMTLAYVAATYRISTGGLVDHLRLPPGTNPELTLNSLAKQEGVSSFSYTQRVQRTIAAAAPKVVENGLPDTPGWLATITDEVLTALLLYGYPALGLTLLLGAVGLPLPDGIATTIAGSLVAQGRMNWIWAGTIAVIASVLGDAVGYVLGRWLSSQILDRFGPWVGFSPGRRARVQALFDRWGLATVFVTRTFMSYLSSVASLLAGIAHYSLSRFLAIALVGRLVWTAAYLGLGYGIGGDWEAATNFLTNFSGLVLSLMLLLLSGAIASGKILSWLL
jgi:membrane protein DedA with SNARE-associated domain